MTLRFRIGDYWHSRALHAWKILTRGDRAFYVAKGVFELHTRQGGRCYLCPAEFIKGHRSRNPWTHTREHVFPSASGGRYEGNILLAHRCCNERKSDRWPYPCEVIFLAAVYAPRHDALAHRLAQAARRAERRVRRLALIERYA